MPLIWVFLSHFIVRLNLSVPPARRPSLAASNACYFWLKDTLHPGRGKNHQAYLWQYSRPGGVVIFDFQPGRGREGPKQFLGHFNGILQTDGCSGYDRVGGPKLIHAGCGAHARRYFFQAVEAHPDDRAAIALVATIDELFAIDAQPRERNLMVTERDRLRQQRAGPILESIKSQIEAARSQTLPKSALAKACNYTLTLWNRLTRFLDHPILELSTNAAENAIRSVALVRNWIHFGSQDAGPRIAAIISIVETCRRLKIPIRDYLAAILPGLADFPANRVHQLTPAAWVPGNQLTSPSIPSVNNGLHQTDTNLRRVRSARDDHRVNTGPKCGVEGLRISPSAWAVVRPVRIFQISINSRRATATAAFFLSTLLLPQRASRHCPMVGSLAGTINPGPKAARVVGLPKAEQDTWFQCVIGIVFWSRSFRRELKADNLFEWSDSY